MKTNSGYCLASGVQSSRSSRGVDDLHPDGEPEADEENGRDQADPKGRHREGPLDRIRRQAQDEEREDVVDHGRADDRLRDGGIEVAELLEHVRGDRDARRGQGRAHEERGGGRIPQEGGDEIAPDPRHGHAEGRDHEVPRVRQVAEGELEPDHEEQEDRAELREGLDEVGVRDPSEHGRPDQDPDQDLADDRRLVDPGGDQVPGEGHEEEQAHLELDGAGQRLRHLTRLPGCRSVRVGRSNAAATASPSN